MKYVIYDGDCGVCYASASFIERKKTCSDLVTIPSFAFDFEKYKIPSELALISVIYFDENTEKYYIKIDAINKIAKNLNKTLKFFSIFLSIPFISIILNPIYDLIAKNRAYVSKILKLNACQIK